VIRPPRPLSALATVAAAIGLSGACGRAATLGPPDAFAVYAPTSGSKNVASGGLPVAEIAPDDPRAQPIYKEVAAGFVGEVLRTDYLAKQLVRDDVLNGRRFGDSARLSASEPAAFVVGVGDGGSTGQGLSLEGFLGRTRTHPDAVWIGLGLYPDHDRALPQTLAGLIGRVAASRVAGGSGAGPSSPLVEGYARSLEVIAREWRVGEGPAGALPPDAGTREQRDLFAAVRENRYVVGAGGAPRQAAELLADPGVAATVLYRLAEAKSVGRKVAPPEVYAPFVADRIPPGVSPAAVLGPFRNFQAKLLSAWARAVLEGRAPRDIADLVDAYGRALPAERSEVVRIFVVTTFGATVRAGGVRNPAGTALAELTALAAEVSAGKLSTRAALTE
jgi:hypothetical protein